MKKILIAIMVILAMTTTASAAVRPGFIEMGPYGLEPAVWMAAIAVICAILHNIGRAYDKKRNNPDFKYDYAYLHTTIMATLVIAFAILDMDIVKLSPGLIVMAMSIGFGGNEISARITKVVK
jgi:hypothetical protein